MSTVTVPISEESHKILLELAAHGGEPIDRLLDKAIEQYRRSCLLDETHTAFAALRSEWRRTRGHSSKIKDLVMNSAYQRIIGMGEPVIPLILEEMEREPDHWSWALVSISGEDPIPASARGRLDETTAAWLKWAHDKGYR